MGAIGPRKVHGGVNPADLFTKHLSSKDRMEALVRLFGCEYREGRAVSAPKLRKKEKEQQQVQVVDERVGGGEDPEAPWHPMHDPDILPHNYSAADIR